MAGVVGSPAVNERPPSRRLALLAGLTLALACHRGSGDAQKVTPTFPSTPVPAPEGLVLDVVARGPDALWGKVQQGVAGPLARLPQSVGGALATVTKLDLSLAAEVDGAAPAYAAVSHPGATFGWAAALRLRDLEHARATLLEGKQPRFTGRAADGGLTVLTAALPVGPAASGNVPAAPYLVALSPLGYLVLAKSEGDLVTLTPYATRTLPARAVSAHALVVAVTHEALTGTIRSQLTDALSTARGAAAMLDATLRRQHGGRSPDLGDPGAVMDSADRFLRERIDVLADLAHAELTLDAGDDDLDIELTCTPGMGPSSKAFADWKTGDASPLLTLSGDTEAAVLLRDDPSTREASTKAAEAQATAAFRPSLSDKDAAAIHQALSSWAAAHGSWLTLGFELEGAPAATLRTPTDDPDRAMRAVTEFVNLAHVPTFRTILEARFSVEGVSTATAQVPGFSAASIATFRRAGSHDGGELAIAWASAGGTLHAAAAGGPARALRATRDPETLLGRDIRFAGKLGTLRDRAALVLALRPRGEGNADGPRSSVVLGVGRDKANGWGMLEIDDAMVRDGIGRWLDL
jgi:hypothetical protein